MTTLGSLPSELRGLLSECFQKDPRCRIADADTLRKRIGALQTQRADSVDLTKWFF